jgi:hypothetical protein
MPIDNGTMITLALVASGVIGTWFVLGYRVRELETKATAFAALQVKVTEIDARTMASASSQGARVAQAQSDVDKLRGNFEGLERGITIALNRRSKTAAQGHAAKAADE